MTEEAVARRVRRSPVGDWFGPTLQQSWTGALCSRALSKAIAAHQAWLGKMHDGNPARCLHHAVAVRTLPDAKVPSSHTPPLSALG